LRLKTSNFWSIFKKNYTKWQFFLQPVISIIFYQFSMESRKGTPQKGIPSRFLFFIGKSLNQNRAKEPAGQFFLAVCDASPVKSIGSG